ncbi:partial RNA polymerase sigma factor SigA, partial [Anaerolineae bacterium]
SQHERVVRVPYEQLSNINKLFRTKEEWLLKTGKDPSVSELATVLGLSENDVSNMMSIAQTALPLENFTGDDEDETIAPIDVIDQKVFMQPDKEITQSELETWLELAIKALNSREAKVIREHFGLEANDEMTLQEIGNKLNISRERVRQIQAMAFNKMKLNYGEQLVSFL